MFSGWEIGGMTDCLVTYVFTDVRREVIVLQGPFLLGDLQVRCTQGTGENGNGKCCN